MIAAAIFAAAGSYVFMADIDLNDTIAWWSALILTVALWTVAGLCAAGVIS